MDTPRRTLVTSNDFHERAAYTRAVQRDGDHVIVLFHGRPVGVYVPVDWYREACEVLGAPLVVEI
jgi:hypothetical protein